MLLGKFQNDEIEERFGQYRQMSGGNYHIILTELLESEKKLKAVSLLKLKSSQAGEFSIKQLCLENSGENELFTDECEDESALLDCNVEDDVKKYMLRNMKRLKMKIWP